MQAKSLAMLCCLALALAVVGTGCDTARRDAERQAQAAAIEAANQRSARIASLRSELQQADTAHGLAAQQLAQHNQHLASLEAELAQTQRNKAQLNEQVTSFLLNHKMAAAALALGLGGAATALDESGQYTPEVKQLGAVASAAAALYVLFNLEEVVHVASQLADAEQSARSLDQRTAALQTALAETRQQAQAAQAQVDNAGQRAQTLRVELQQLSA